MTSEILRFSEKPDIYRPDGGIRSIPSDEVITDLCKRNV